MPAKGNSLPRGICPECGDEVPLQGPNATHGFRYVARHRGAPFKAGCRGEGKPPANCIKCGGTEDLRDRGMAPGMTYCRSCREATVS